MLPHVGFPDLDWAFGLAGRFPQIWLDLTHVPGSFGFFGVEDEDTFRQTMANRVETL